MPENQYRSRFGGLWPDRTDALELLEEKERSDAITADQAEQLRTWMDTGAVVIPGAVPAEVVDRIRADIDAIWKAGNHEVFVEEWTRGKKRVVSVAPEHQDERTKLLDLYAFSEAAREAVFARPTLDFLTLLFERPAVAFQSLMFQRGTGQPMHQDTAYVGVGSPLEFVGTWLALEDIEPGSGELEYFEGSHKFEEYLFDGKGRKMPPGYRREQDYLDSLALQAAQMGLQRVPHRPRKGDVIVWHADLAHGGSALLEEGLTRWSLVTHYCPADVDPDYFGKVPHTGRIAHPSGAYYCLPRRWAKTPVERSFLVLTRLFKTTWSRVTRGLG